MFRDRVAVKRLCELCDPGKLDDASRQFIVVFLKELASARYSNAWSKICQHIEVE